MKKYGLNSENTPPPVENISPGEIAAHNQRVESGAIKERIEALNERIARVAARRKPAPGAVDTPAVIVDKGTRQIRRLG